MYPQEAWVVLEKGSLIGVSFGVIALLFTILAQAQFNIGVAMVFFDIPSVILVLGGAVASSITSVPFEQFMAAMKAGSIVFKPPKSDPSQAINKIVELANTARKEGVLALEDSVASMDDEFLKKGIMLIVDGTDPELVKGIMETELAYIDERHENIAGVYEGIATYAPSWGMKGTLIGLVLMLGDLDDIAMVGPNMAAALITTFYGAIVASVWGNPFANKLKQFSGAERLLKTVLIEGILSIQAGENPRIIEEKLKSFLAPAMRSAVGEGSGGGSEE